MKEREENSGKSVFSDKKKWLLLLVACGGVFLLLLGGMAQGEGEKITKNEGGDVGFYTEYLEEKITNLCLSIRGIEEVEVFLTLECSSEFQYTSDTAADYLILKDENGERAVMLCEIYPRVRGVAVVCNSGEQSTVQERITELLSAALGIPTNKIKVGG